MGSTDSSSGSQQPHLPPGFRFHPTDEELVVHYLKKKASSSPLPVTIIAEVDLYKFDPWELPGKATFGEQEWYFFSPRDRKYPNGARPNRAATSGYWKATGTDKPILTSGGNQKVGVKKALVFYGGRPPKGIKTNWIMHEYRLVDNNTTKPPTSDAASKKNSLRLDDWVLCRIYKKNISNRPMEPDKGDKGDSMDDMLASVVTSINGHQNTKSQVQRPANFSALLDNDEIFFDGLLNDDGMNGNPMPKFPSSTTKTKSELPMVSATGTLPLKRTLNSQYWNDTGPMGSPSKRLHSSDNDSTGGTRSNGSNSMSLLLNQLPQGATFHQNSFLGSINDGVLRQQNQLLGLNWN